MIIIYILFIHIFFILLKNKPVEKHVCGSQRRNGKDMIQRRRLTTR